MTTDARYQIPEQVLSGRRLGRNVNHDPRSLRFLVASPARELKSVTHQRVIPVLDQGDLGMCTGAASVGALGTQPIYGALSADYQAALDVVFAREVYSDASELDEFPGTWPPNDTGSDGLSAAKACQKRGLISGYLHATSLSAMQNALQDTPVIVGTNWYAGMDNTDADGQVHVTGANRGGHEWEVIGLDLETQMFEAVNSWGPTWGKDGHFFISFTDMERLLDEDGDCTQFLPLTVAAPVPTPVPTPVPGAATFPVATDLATRIGAVAQRAKVTGEAWLDRHLRSYFR